MNKIIGDDSLRRALAAIAPAPKAAHNEQERAAQQAQALKAEQWMQAQLRHSIANATQTGWILDCDTTIKTLFGHQSGAQVSYNPHKPGRPSHAIHTYWMANMRLVLHAQVQGGKSHSAKCSLPGLMDLLARLPVEQRPYLVRGDCAFGNEGTMCELEEVKQPYLFKLKQSANVKRLVQRQWHKSGWCDVGQGWQACEDRLKLVGWSCARRVIVMRHEVKGQLSTKQKVKQAAQAKSAKAQEPQQECLELVDPNEPSKIWEYAVLVTNSQDGIERMGQLYRDRADCENGFDELKNQWGWGGYSTQDIERCNLSAQAVALIYNWWSWYVRLAHPKGRLEAITSRPLLLAAVGKVTTHAGQKRVLLSLTHAAASQVKALVVNIRAGLASIRATASQLSAGQRWKALVGYIVEKILGIKPTKFIHAAAPPSLALA